MNDNDLSEIQAVLETKLRHKLLTDPSEQSFQSAYDNLHRFFMEQESKQELYPSKIRWFSRIFIDRIRSGKRVLDIGAGNGKLAIELARNGNNVTGIDISKIAIEIANAKLETLPDSAALEVSFQYGDARMLGFADNMFDYVVSHDLVEHISERDFVKHIGEVERVLKPGGKYMFWTPSRLRGGSSLGLHLREYTIREMDQILRRTDFDYDWIDLRFYALKANLQLPKKWLPLVIFYESLIEPLIKYVPGGIKKILVPPLLFSLEKTRNVDGDESKTGQLGQQQ